MPPFIRNFAFVLTEFLRIPFDLVIGNKRRVYTLSTEVNAPKDISWAVASAHKIKLESSPPMEIDTTPDPLRPRVFTGACRIGERTFPFAYEVIDERPGEALQLRLLMSKCDPVYRLGDDYIGTVVVASNDRQSFITNSCEMTHTKLSSRFILPVTLLRAASSLKRTAEVRSGNGQRTAADQLKNAAITGALTFASFFALFGASIAAELLIVILLHELGHVIAMRCVGIPVRGIYFVPFFGGVAVGDSLGATEATRGLVALMGPAFSIVTTMLFAFASSQSNEPFLTELALLSALLNGFNLLPILPLDGGRILQALTSLISAQFARIIHALMLCAGIGLAVVLGDYLLLAVMLLIVPATLSAQGKAIKLAPLTRGEFVWLSSGYVATLVFYVAIALRIWNEVPVLGE